MGCEAPSALRIATAREKAFGAARGLRVISLAYNIFLLCFNHKVDREKAIGKGPWHFDRFRLVLQELGLNETPHEVDSNWVDIHVRLLEVPGSICNQHMGEVLGARLAQVQ